MKKLQNSMYGQLSEQLEMDIIILSVEGQHFSHISPAHLHTSIHNTGRQ